MEKIFLSVLNMSLTGSFVIAVIILARLILKKAPKIISYALWSVAGFRLVFPFTLESVVSLLPFNSAPIPQDIAKQAIPRIESGIKIIDNVVSGALPVTETSASVNPLELLLFIGSYIWIIGIGIMLIYSLVSIAVLKRRLRGAVPVEGNLYQADNLKTPFVIGLFRPKIYIPSELSDEERRYIVLHEQTHIRRHDHIVKMFSYFVLCLHWFNPLVWVAFLMMGADMEMSCDEGVIRELGVDIKNAYSMSLIRVAAGRKIINGSPLAFGEGGMKGRIKNVLNFKKRSRVIIIGAVALVVVLIVGLSVNRTQLVSTDTGAQETEPESESPIETVSPDSSTQLGIIPDNINVPDGVLAASVDVLRAKYEWRYRDIEIAKIEYGTKFDNWRLDYLEHAYSYHDMGLEVYRFQWRIHTTTPDTVRTKLTGGMELDEDGWLMLDTYPDSNYLVFTDDINGEPVHLLTMSENDCTPGDDIFTYNMLNRVDEMRKAQLTVYLSDLFTEFYSSYYENLQYQMSYYEETTTANGDYTATFDWQMSFMSTEYYDAPSDIGKWQEVNYSLQATSKIDAYGLLDLSTIEILGDNSVYGAANYEVPIEEMFPEN